MKILIDIAGADKGVLLPVEAATNLVDKIDSDIVLVGKREDIYTSLKEINKEKYINKFEILECDEYISNNEEPAFAIKNKKNSNLVVAYNYMKENDDTALISASSTGALMAGALLKLGRIKGIHRPALITLLPTISGGQVIFLDSGANPMAKEISLIQYAKLGEIYAKNVLNITSPKIALLNIGAEEEKGTPELKEAYKLLKKDYPNFIGNIEARYILKGKADVIVCDGLMGNIALKSLEGAVSTIKNVLVGEFKKNIFNKFRAMFVKGMLKKVLGKFNYKEHDGGVLLGVKKLVIKVHGSSSMITYEKAIIQTDKILREKIIEKIEKEI